MNSMSTYSGRHPLRDCANVTVDVYSRGADGVNLEKDAVPSLSDDSTQALRQMQQACQAMVQREAENTMMMMEDAVRVRTFVHLFLLDVGNILLCAGQTSSASWQ